MDPIKVDFSKKESGRQSEIVIPPEKAGLKIAICLILTVITGAVAYYVMLPAINFKSYDLYLFIGITALSYIVWNALITKALAKPEYMPYVKKRAIVPGIIIGVLVLALVVGYVVSSQFFRAKSYSRIIDVETDTSFSDDLNEEDAESFSSIPRLDAESAYQVASRAIGSLGEMGYVSQFTVAAENTQINYRETPVRVAPLQYASIIKWLYNTREGFPGYVIIDMANENAEFVELEGGNIRYSPYEHFNKLLQRKLRFEYPTYLFADATFEIDDEGNPYWICARLDKTIGLFGGTDVIGAVVVKANSADFESSYYTIEQINNDAELQWIDRIYSADLLVEQYNYYGKYSGGFWNSILGQKNVVRTTSGYNYIAKDDDVWMYTGITSVTSDQSITGFALVNQRTKEAKFYSVTGGTENSAQLAAEGRVKDLGYTATFPLLLNIGGEPTYFLSLKDVSSGSNIVQQYALINVKQYNNNKMGANGNDLAKCLAAYIEALSSSGIKVDIDPEEVARQISENENGNGENSGETENQPAVQPEPVSSDTVTGKIADIRSAVLGGESVYYVKLDSGSAYYSIKASDNQAVVILNVGDTVTIKFEGSGSILTAKSITKN